MNGSKTAGTISWLQFAVAAGKNGNRIIGLIGKNKSLTVLINRLLYCFTPFYILYGFFFWRFQSKRFQSKDMKKEYSSELQLHG